MVVFKYLAEWQIDRVAPIYNLEFPFITNLPYHLLQDPATMVFTSNCDQADCPLIL